MANLHDIHHRVSICSGLKAVGTESSCTRRCGPCSLRASFASSRHVVVVLAFLVRVRPLLVHLEDRGHFGSSLCCFNSQSCYGCFFVFGRRRFSSLFLVTSPLKLREWLISPSSTCSLSSMSCFFVALNENIVCEKPLLWSVSGALVHVEKLPSSSWLIHWFLLANLITPLGYAMVVTIFPELFLLLWILGCVCVVRAVVGLIFSSDW